MQGQGRATRFPALLGALCLAFFLSACDDNGNGGAGTTPTPSPTETAALPTTPTPTPTPVPGAPGDGISASILGASVTEDGTLTVRFSLTDAAGIPIRPVLSPTQNPAEGRVRFTVARLETYSGGGEFGKTFTRYVNLVDATRPAYDRGGILEVEDAGSGTYRYTFATRLSDGFDPAATYTVGMQVDRTFEGRQLGANPVFDFVPGGGTPEVRAGSETAACNQCHDPLREHGNRTEFRLCTLCHTEAAVDELGRSVDLRVMIHKIHRGKELPSIEEGAPGSRYAIFSSFLREDIVFAEKLPDGRVVGVGFPRPVNDCAVCHTGGPTAEHYLEQPSAAACSSCHDDVNPSLVETEAGPPGTGHFQNKGFADGDCSFCHVSSDKEFDISVAGAHLVPERSSQLRGLQVEILGLSNHGPGETPTVEFRVTESSGAPLTDLSGLNRLAFVAAGPTLEYERLLSVTAVGGGASGTLEGPDAEGVFRYTFPTALPADATGTWALGAEARRTVELEAPEGETRTVNEAAPNPVVTFQVDDSETTVRREVVADENCRSCHGEFSKGFSVHGNLRNRIEYCVLCHNPNGTDVARRRRDPEAVARGDRNETIDFKVLIHKIHTGEELQQKPYIVYGFGPPPAGFTPHDFGEVRFPGDRRNCEKCHLPGTFLLPPFPGPAMGPLLTRLDPATGDEIVDGILPPIAAVCTSCHDSNAALAHAATGIDDEGRESCTVCHAEGHLEPVSVAHER